MKIKQAQNKAGSFCNVATIQDDEGDFTYVIENVNDILVRQENQYLGWLCWAGLESLCIASNGDVFVATCRNTKLGNIYTDFDLPNDPVICKKSYCACAADLNTSKAKDKESAKYLRVTNEDR